MLYRKKPVVIEAFQLGVDHMPNWFVDKVRTEEIAFDEKLGAYIQTLEGVMQAGVGDYIIKGVAGEIYPCKPDIFNKTYEAVWEENF